MTEAGDIASQDDLASRLTDLNAALFLDFDGVLVEIAERPDAVVVPEGLGKTLKKLETRFDGALAIVTGRSAADLRRYLPDIPARVLASHGAETDLSGNCEPRIVLDDASAVPELQSRVEKLAERDQGLLAEDKPLGVVFHYRGAPELGAGMENEIAEMVKAFPEFELHKAKMAFEVRPKAVGKDRAVADVMERTPFHGRTPVYFGDDLTDEAAFAWVDRAGGITVKVGDGDTCARERVAAVADVIGVLRTMAGRTKT